MSLPQPPSDLHEQVARALAEDIGAGDLTAALIPEDQHASATLLCREPAVICGQPWVEACLEAVDPRLQIAWRVSEGAQVAADTVLAHIEGPARGLLTAERTALNFLQTLSGTATVTARYVERIRDTGCRVLDTRKTLPGLRTAQKYAVRCGGGHNHRMGLYDALLIKENHIAAAGSITAAVAEGRRRFPHAPIEVETETLEEVNEALQAGADRIMLDNFSLEAIRRAVERVDGQCELEVSGNVNLDNIRDYALTGVDYISVGALTKHLHAIDLSLRVETVA
ncbi:MAG: carboxylating nicotinate-nucleotide diphosphorylase [Gammaproteobacteria bacterium]|nr:MAG: carboxylating nicotinate-nucleotide diphosphorylase [Gammaproteobacteria bacterium]